MAGVAKDLPCAHRGDDKKQKTQYFVPERMQRPNDGRQNVFYELARLPAGGSPFFRGFAGLFCGGKPTAGQPPSRTRELLLCTHCFMVTKSVLEPSCFRLYNQLKTRIQSRRNRWP